LSFIKDKDSSKLSFVEDNKVLSLISFS
jgi:hypothetical protein